MRQMALGLAPTPEHSLKHMSASQRSRNGALVFMVVANLLGTPLFLYFSSQFWAPRGQEGLLGGPGEPILWTILALPWLAAVAFSNIAVIPRMSTELFFRKDVRLLLVWCACILMFFSAWVYDGSRQFNGSLVSDDNFGPGQSGHGATMKEALPDNR